MIVTVTVNTTLDRTLIVPFFQMHTTMRASQSVISMGGKPTDASFILGKLGIPSLALGFAAGLTGQQMEHMLQARGVATDFIQVDGETRINTVIISESDHGHATITTSTLDVRQEHVTALRKRYQAALTGATCVVLGGTLPRGVEPALYTEFIKAAKDRALPVVFDASSPEQVVGIESRPDFVKPNRAELAWVVGRTVGSLDEIYAAGREILAKYGTSPIVTLGEEGALAVLPGRAYRIPPLEIDVVSPAGAGDAVLAGMAAALSRGDPPEEGLRLGFAAATAVCLMPGTADCRREDVERFLPQIELIPYPG